MNQSLLTMYRTILIVTLMFILAGCGGLGMSRVETAPPADAEIPTNDYAIGVDDVVRVDVWGKPELGATVPVRPDGMVSVPLIGDMQAVGKTPKQLSRDIETALSQYVKDPVVAVILTEIRSHEYLSRIRVTGAVREPVSLAYRQGMTVLDAILAAGGPTEFAQPERSKLYRKTTGGAKSYQVLLGSILNRGDLATNYELRPGDIITVPERLF